MRLRYRRRFSAPASAAIAVSLLAAGGGASAAAADVEASVLTDAARSGGTQGAARGGEVSWLPISYSGSMQPLVEVTVGEQAVKLVFDASSGNTIVFVKEKQACNPVSLEQCYSYKEGERRKTLRVCSENNDANVACDIGPSLRYSCDRFLSSLSEAHSHGDALIIDGVEYDQKAVEAVEHMSITTQGAAGRSYAWSSTPVRLLVEVMNIHSEHSDLSIDLFQGAGGILGGSGPSLSCRNTTAWANLLKEVEVDLIALDFSQPPNATIVDPGQSRLVFNDIDPNYAMDLIWSQPKQTGDIIDDGMHEFLMFRPEVCGIDLLYNTSSNWLAVIDTSGPCLMFPPFLFDRLITRIPVNCPFEPGAKSQGRLCSPARDASKEEKLPSLSFAMEDAREPMPRRLELPLERLVFKSGRGAEFLCLARDDTDRVKAETDMMYSHIALGSLAVASLYTVVDLKNHTVGLASKGHPVTESSEATCRPSVSCTGMQTYFPPQNLCQDPECSDYMFMVLDPATKTCVWPQTLPVIFGCVLGALVVLDLLGHKLYKQAVEKASESSQ